MEKFDFNQATFKAHSALKQEGFLLKRSHVGEILAAALGYMTYAALATESADETLDLHLADAEYVVLSVPLALARAHEFVLALPKDVVEKVIEVIIEITVAEWPQAYHGIAGFVDDHLSEYFTDAMTFADETSNAQAESNAQFPYMVEVEDIQPESDDLWTARESWSASASGAMSGEYDPAGDRLFNGDKVHCSATVTFLKAGRGGLVFSHVDTNAAAGDWGDDAKYDEPMAQD